MCIECYIDENRITPLFNPIECLQNHTQYTCGTCERTRTAKYVNTQIRKLTSDEVQQYMSER